MRNIYGDFLTALSRHQVPLLSGAIVVGYLWSLGRVLRGEKTSVRMCLFFLVVLALCLRFSAPHDFPPGMNEDEPKILACARDAWKAGRVHTEGCTGVPLLLNVLFQAQLVDVLGPNRESIRFYAGVTGAFSVVLAYGLARALQFSREGALSYAALVTTLPWSLYYGRISQGGELTFHQLLLLVGLARIVFTQGGWRDAFMASFGQALLLYDYFVGRLFLPFSILALVLTRGRRRLLTLCVPLLAAVAWLPYLFSGPQHLWAPRGQRPHLEWEAILASGRAVFEAFLWPRALDFWFSVRSAAVHPVPLLVLSCVGGILVLRYPRKALFILGGFLVGVSPAVGTIPSAHRMLMAYPFISLLGVYALDRLPQRRWRVLASAVFVAAMGLASVRFFFSNSFWPQPSRAVSGAGITQLVESIPYPLRSRLIISPGLGYFFSVRERTDRDRVERLNTENWWPSGESEVIYAYSGHWDLLEPFYRGMLGAQRVRSFGGPFSVTVEPGDWTWLRRYGWAYEVECASSPSRWSGQVPVLFHIGQTVPQFLCSGSVRHRWQGRWVSDNTLLRFRFRRGTAAIVIEEGSVLSSEKSPLDFDVPAGASVSVSLTVPDPGGFDAFLFRISPAGEVVPPWPSVKPES